MKERPIVFSGPMVSAILDGRKTQTRRICKVYKSPHGCRDDNGWPLVCDQNGEWHKEQCPYGERGDKLWVRETFVPTVFPNAKIFGHIEHGAPANFVYKADCRDMNGYYWPEVASEPEDVRWKPSIHMPRAASRILLEVTDVRVERVQDISEEDAIAEGVERHPNEHLSKFTGCPAWTDYQIKSPLAATMNARGSFRTLWDSINAKRGFGWGVNPWVWVVSFKRIEAMP